MTDIECQECGHEARDHRESVYAECICHAPRCGCGISPDDIYRAEIERLTADLRVTNEILEGTVEDKNELIDERDRLTAEVIEQKHLVGQASKNAMDWREEAYRFGARTVPESKPEPERHCFELWPNHSHCLTCCDCGGKPFAMLCAKCWESYYRRPTTEVPDERA